MIAQFAAALRESEARERAEQERRRARKSAAEQLEVARVELDQAIEGVRRARRTRSGVAEADAAWRAAKARVIELETGATPEWAPPAEGGSAQPDGQAGDLSQDEVGAGAPDDGASGDDASGDDGEATVD